MSEYLGPLLVTAWAPRGPALSALEGLLELLRDRYQFGFRGMGLVERPIFAGDGFKNWAPADEQIASVTDIDRPTIAQLASKYRGFCVAGSIRHPDVNRLLDLHLALYPVADAFCIVVHLDASLKEGVWTDPFDSESAQRLRQLCIELAARPQVDGFMLVSMESLHGLRTFSGTELRDYLLAPLQSSGEPLRGSLYGIKKSLLSIDALPSAWKESDRFETIHGFSIVSSLKDYSAWEEEPEEETKADEP